MRRPHHDAHLLQGRHRGEDPLSDHSVLLHQQPLLAGQRPGLLEHGVRNGDLADVMQLGRDRQLLEVTAVEAELHPDGNRHRRDAAHVLAQLGIPFVHRLEQRDVRLRAAQPRHVLLRVEPAVGERERRRGVPRFGRDDGRAERRRDVEAVALLTERCGRIVEEPLDDVRAGAGEHAELVAAEPVGLAAVRLDCGREPARETAQKRVARRMAEAVVVVLEAVQVVDDQHALVRHQLDVGDQLAPVADPAERVAVRRAAVVDGAVDPNLALARHHVEQHSERQREQHAQLPVARRQQPERSKQRVHRPDPGERRQERTRRVAEREPLADH